MTTDCEFCRNQMPDALYDSLSTTHAARFKAHLDTCSSCAREYEELQLTLALVEQEWDTPHLASPSDVWERLEPQLDAIDHAKHRRRFALFRILPLAAIVLIGLGLTWWYQTQGPTNPPSENHPPVHAGRLQPPEMAQYLAKTQPLLLAIANQHGSSTATGFEHTYERGLAANLAKEAHNLGETLPGRKNRRDRALLEDIRYLLLQVANLDETHYDSGMALAREVLEEETILFRINLFELRERIL